LCIDIFGALVALSALPLLRWRAHGLWPALDFRGGRGGGYERDGSLSQIPGAVESSQIPVVLKLVVQNPHVFAHRLSAGASALVSLKASGRLCASGVGFVDEQLDFVHFVDGIGK